MRYRIVENKNKRSGRTFYTVQKRGWFFWDTVTSLQGTYYYNGYWPIRFDSINQAEIWIESDKINRAGISKTVVKEKD